jgi:signal transduction histidine kinase/ligand-binding sensor domain-containing protein
MKYKNFNLLKSRPVIAACFSLAVLLWPVIALSQKYSFTNYSIEDGLLQSQVTRILQDKTHHLVITTFLGTDRFDGKTFTPVTKDNNLTDVFWAVTIDHTGKIWCSNSSGLYYFYADHTTRFVGDNKASLIAASELLADKLDNIWGLRKRRIFKITGSHVENINVSGKADTITAITLNKDGDILAAVVNKGIFCLKNNKWVNIEPLALPKGSSIAQFIAGDNNDDPIYISTGTEVLSIRNHVLNRLNINFKKDGVNLVYCIARDNSNGLWIGTNKGAYHLNNNTLQYFNESNGFTDNQIYDIFKDFDNNMWFGTNGAGIFRFDGDSFLIFNQAQGITEPILQLAKDQDDNILMTGGNKLMAYNGKKITRVSIPLPDTINNYFHCLYTDPEKNTWIVTQKQLWKKNGVNFTCFYPRNKTDARISFNAVLQDRLKTFWAAAGDGCYYWDHGFKKIGGITYQCTSLIEIGRDSILAGTRNNIFLVKNKKSDQHFNAAFLKSSNIMCLKYYKGRLYAGTIDNGLFIWYIHGGPVIHLNEKNGLSSASVYSIDIDKNDVLWLGTGRAVNQFKIKDDGTFQKIINENIGALVLECNQDALLFNNNQVWIGATKGVYVFKNDLTSNTFTAPYTTIQNVLFYDNQAANYTYKNGYKEPQNLKLPFNNSHITISFNGIYLKNPGNVSYSYKLSPLDTRFSSPVNNNVVDYPSLPPGSYVFYVKSYNLTGTSSNIAGFSFEVIPAYYQTVIFKVAIVVLLFLLSISIWKYLEVKEEQKRRLIAQLRLEEQVKIRKQTAEDFHDDLGNKLTRINVLSQLLYKKIDKGFSDQTKLIDQIRENADALFTGSKHILWALDPKNDRLSEVMLHIKEFGIDLFLNTDISFTSNLAVETFKEITLPMGYGRNITMILKELFNNSLRHSGAKNVKASAFLTEDRDICIIVEDDGKGFDMNTIKSGNGLRNLINRAKKLNGTIEVKSLAGEGTTATLVIKRIPDLY